MDFNLVSIGSQRVHKKAGFVGHAAHRSLSVFSVLADYS